MNLKVFFEYIKNAPFGGRLTQSQVSGIMKGLEVMEKRGVTRNDHKAYIMATAFWETGKTMEAIREAFGKTDRQSIDRLEKAWKAGKLASVKTPYWRDGWFGRGIVQLTWKDNYLRMGKELGIDLVGDPSLMLDPDISWNATVVGMQKGMFSKGNTLDKYFNDKRQDPENARRIVNGTDKAKLIALYWKNFFDAFEKASEAPEEPKTKEATPVAKTPEKAFGDDVKPMESPAVVTTIGTIASSGIVTSLMSVNNIYGVFALGILIIAAGTLGYLFWSGKFSVNKEAS